MSWQRKERGADAGLKSRFHIGEMTFTLAGAKCILTTPVWENVVLGKAGSFGAVLSLPCLLQLALAQLTVTWHKLSCPAPELTPGKDNTACGAGPDYGGWECAGEWYQPCWSCACVG